MHQIDVVGDADYDDDCEKTLMAIMGYINAVKKQRQVWRITSIVLDLKAAQSYTISRVATWWRQPFAADSKPR